MSYKIAGIDVHQKVLMVVVMDASAPDEKPERRRFATVPSELRRLSIWLRPDPQAKRKRAQMLARALRKLGYEVAITPINLATAEHEMHM